MIEASVLLKALQRLLKDLEEDLRSRVTPDAATSPHELEIATKLDAKLRAEYREAKEGGRTGQAFEIWRDEFLTQVAVAWILGCVFVRFMEDNGLVETPRLSGPSEHRQRALDQHELYFKDPQRRTHSDREYLLDVFEQTQKLPAARELFDAKHNPVWAVGLSGDGATKLLQFWQRLDPESGALDHDFTDPDWNTRFLGDLYQDLSESARKKYALLQTPEFVEEFILDRTFTPAIEEFGFQEVRLIDPTCGSGHFLLGAFHRLFDLWVKQEPGANPRELVQRSLNQVCGVDLNPFAVAIAKFRLLVEALKACGVTRLSDAPGFHLDLAIGDSLLHGSRPGLQGATQKYLDPEEDPLRHVYQTEDAEALRRILGQQYHAVVGNPPYITVKDKALNQAYRIAYSSCYMKYSLGVPFTQRFFELALPGGESRSAGFVGMITTNSFMKREFGKKLIQETLPKLDLTHVIDTSGAYIPGHGTPTAILFGRNRSPLTGEVRTVMGIRGEPFTPEDPSQGQVWLAIMGQLDTPGSESEFISVADYPRDRFRNHPWSLGGGGAAELKELIETAAEKRLGDIAEAIGITAVTGEDSVYMLGDEADGRRLGIESTRPLVTGDIIRDWSCPTAEPSAWLYDGRFQLVKLKERPQTYRYLWPFRSNLSKRKRFGTPMLEKGLTWFEWQELYGDKLRSPLSIAFAFVAPHNHFVLDRGGKVFKQSAPVIKLPSDTTEEDHLALLAFLNSSSACFWMKQVSQQKQLTGGDGVRVEFISKVPYEFASTQLANLPLPRAFFAAEMRHRFVELGRSLDQLGQDISLCNAQACIREGLSGGEPNLQKIWEETQRQKQTLRSKAVLLQEELDFTAYVAFGLCSEELLGADEPDSAEGLDAGMRPFEVRQGQNQDGYPVPESIPGFSDPNTAAIWKSRLSESDGNYNLKIIEDPHYKRRWIGRQGLFNHTANQDELADASASWLLDLLETPAYWPASELQTTARLADRAAQDADFMQVAEVYAGHPDFDVASLVRELVEGEAVPSLSACRYKPAGLRKRLQWELTWQLQRQEDAIDARAELDPVDPEYLSAEDAASLKGKEVGKIPAPPKYTSADFQKSDYWRLRGKLDVPKEHFVSFPSCERDSDPSPVVGWAGWNHLELAQATAAYYLEMKEQEGWPAERLIPLLTALLELLPWVKQWHNDLDDEHGVRMGDYFDDFVNEEARGLDLTLEQIEAWTPPKMTRTRKPRKKAAPKKTEAEATSS